jgi:hypothetical protein
VGRAENDEKEEEREHELRDEGRPQRVTTRRVLTVAIGCEAAGDNVEALLAAGDYVQHERRCDAAEELGDPIGK